MPDIAQQLLTISNEDRIALLTTINEEKKRLTALSKVIDASNQECSRHLSRLVESGLIRKNPDGTFETTPVGKAVLKILPSLQFLLHHKNYFLSHDPSYLPTSFIERIGELVHGRLVGHFNIVLEHIKKTIAEAEEYLWLIADQPIIPTPTVGVGFPSRDLPVRLIIQPGFNLDTFSKAKSALPTRFEIGLVRNVRIAMAINEKTAGICFPGPDGKIDFGVGFIGTDETFRTWSGELFEYYWKSAEQARF